MAKPEQVYRFALYGLSGSGKTSILAALAMDHEPSGNYSCVSIPFDEEDYHGTAKNLIEARKSGDKYRKEAVAALEAGKVAKATDINSGLMIYSFKFADDHGGEFVADLYDYSGELIDPNRDRSELGREICKHLATLDGLLVLAPIAIDPADNEKINAAEVHQLAQAFEQIHQTRQRKIIPTVLLLNKWDLYNPQLAYQNPAAELQKVTTFFAQKPTPRHKRLFDDLIRTFGEENIAVFPVSAFGESEVYEGHYRPKQLYPLQTFGLEEGFIWLARRHDELALTQLQEKLGKLMAWWPWPFVPALGKEAQALQARFRPSSELHKRATQLVKRRNVLRLKRHISLFLLIFSVTLSAEFYVDYRQYATYHLAANNPEATEQDVAQLKDWLVAYTEQAPQWRHTLSKWVLLTDTQAATELADLRAGREAHYWETVTTCKTIEGCLLAVNAYLEQYGEAGSHATEARQLLLETQVAQTKRDEAIEWQAVQEAQKHRTPEEFLAKTEAYLAQFPTGEHASKVRAIQEPLLAALDWQAFYARYQARMDDAQYAEVAQLLVNRRPITPQLDKLKQAFFVHLEGALQQLLAKQAWEKAEQALQRYRLLPLVAEVDSGQVWWANQQQHLIQRKEDFFWKPVLHAGDLATKAAKAKVYLAHISAGTHVDEANTIIADHAKQMAWQAFYAEYQKRLDKKQWARVAQHLSDASDAYPQLPATRQAFLQRFIAELDSVVAEQAWATMDDLITTQKSFMFGTENLQLAVQRADAAKEAAFWKPVSVAPNLQDKALAADKYITHVPTGSHVDDALKIIARYNASRDWQAFQRQYQGAIAGQQYADAANMLLEREKVTSPKDSHTSSLIALRNSFRAGVHGYLEGDIQQALRQDSPAWQTLYDKLSQYENIVPTLKPADSREWLQIRRAALKRQHDRYLYDKCRHSLNPNDMRVYLDTAPLQSMRKYVETYFNYFQQMKGVLPLKLFFSKIEWGEDDSTTYIEIFVDESKEFSEAKHESSVHEPSFFAKRIPIQKRLDDNIKIRIKAIGSNWITLGVYPLGEGSFNGKVTELIAGYGINMRVPDKDFVSRAYFSIEGIPTEPELPKWQP